MPILWSPFEGRGDQIGRNPPQVFARGDQQGLSDRMGMFKQRYATYVGSAGRSIVQSNIHREFFDDGSYIIIVSNGLQDTVHLYAPPPGEKKFPIEGFLVTFEEVDASGAHKQRLYWFDFDKNAFKFMELSRYKAGNRRVQAGDVFVSYDGTGGGDIAPNVDEAPRPNHYVEPFKVQSGKLFSQGVEYPFVEGKIFGIGCRGSMVMAAALEGSRMVLHVGDIRVRPGTPFVEGITYRKVVGVAQVQKQCVVNFNAKLDQCVCGGDIVSIPTDPAGWGATNALQVTKIDTGTGEELLWSGFVGSAVRYTTRKTVVNKAVGAYIPTNTYEYIEGWTSSPDGKVTRGERKLSFEYLDITRGDAKPTAPTYAGNLAETTLATVLLKPIIVMNGIYPQQAYTWMRTVAQVEGTEDDTFYWYRDYKADEFVYCRWERGYVNTSQWDEYGAGDPYNGSTILSSATSINKQKVVSNPGTAAVNWFYTVGNGRGDFALRRKPNNEVSDVLLVSKSGDVRTLTGALRVDIL